MSSSTPPPPPPPPPAPDKDDLYKLSDADKKAGVDAIEPLPGSLNLYIVRYRKQPIKVDLSLKDWASKLKTESNDCGVPESALTVALKRLHLIETEKLLEVARHNEVQRNKDLADKSSSSATTKAVANAMVDNMLSLTPQKQTTAEKLVELILNMDHEMFVDQHGHPFIVTKHKPSEAIELLDQDFVEYASGLFYDQTNGDIPNGNDIKNAANVLAYKAKKQFVDRDGDPIVRPLYVRVAWDDPDKRDIIYLDIADKKRHIIVIKKGDGFRVINQNDAQVMFRRQNRLPLPIPPQKYDEDIADQFLDLYQIPKDAHAKRLVAKCMMGIRMIPGIPHPIELPHGGKGGLKSSWCEAQKRIIDPATAMALRIPENEDDFALQGYHNYMLVYDNVKQKNVPKWFPDALCRWVYLEATEKRQHYSNMKTVAFGSSGCAMVNGINKMFEEEDVLDRCVMSEWRRLKPGQFKTKAKVEEEFQRIQPQLFAYLCDKTAKALELYKDVEAELESKHLLSRMADFMVWGECFARAYDYESLEFVKAYTSNLELQNVEIIQNSLLGKVIVNFTHREYQLIVKERRAVGTAAPIKYNKTVGKNAVVVFEGTIDAFYKKLQDVAMAPPFSVVDLERSKEWPKGTNKLSQWVRLILSNLSEAFGIDIELVTDTTGKLTKHKNRIWVQVTKNPDVAPAELFGSEDKDDSNGSMRLRGKGPDEGGPPPSPSSRRARAGSSKTVSTNKPLPSLPSLPLLEESTGASKGSKDSKDTLDKTTSTTVAATVAPTFNQVMSLETFENTQKLHQVCRSLVNIDWEYAEDSSETDPDVYLFAYVDTKGNQDALHVDDFANPREFAIVVNRLIESYDYSVAYWSRGKDSERITDLMQWHNFCVKVAAYSIVEPVSDYDHYPTIRSLNNPKHRHIDAYLIHNQTFIKSGVYKGAIRSMKLDDVHQAAFPTRKMGKLPGVDGSNVNEMPVDVQKAYCLRDAQMVYEIMTKANGQLLGVMQTIAEYIDRDIEYVCHARDMGYLVEPVLTQMGYPRQSDPVTGKAINWWDETYTGGLVQPPIRGRHKHVMGIDCVGMYPEIVINYNISSETVCCRCCEYDPKARDRALTGDPEVDAKGYWICIKREGLFPQFMKGLKEKRKEFKRLRDNAKSTEEYQQYDIAQLAIKLYMNASYGCFGFRGFEYADKRVAELITGIGRKFAIGAKELAESEKYGFTCIYGDTDGLLLKARQNDTFTDKTFTNKAVKQHLKPLIDECYQRFNLPIDNDRNFIEATPVEKKQYFGIDPETKKVTVKGLEGMKQDACRFDREQFKLLMNNYEKGIDPISYVKAGLEKIDKGELTAEDLAIKVKLSRDAEEYDPKTAMGKIARAYNGKRNDVVSYYLTGTKGNAFSTNFEDCNIERYKLEHLTDIGKVLHAMGYDVDVLYGPEMKASEVLRKRQEKNDKKNQTKKKKEEKKRATLGHFLEEQL